MSGEKPKGKAAGGKARADKLSPERRKEIALNAAKAKADLKSLPRATHGSSEHPMKIGDIEIPCYVLTDGTRVLSQRGLQTGMGMSISGGSNIGEQRMAVFVDNLAAKGIEIKDLSARIRSPIRFVPPGGGNAAFGYEATILADLCDAVLAARNKGVLLSQQAHIATQCELLVRGFARVGIIALVDEATGYQKDRAKDALAQILEAFVAKEIQPYMKTFPADYYEQLFRLYNLQYPPVGNKSWRPGFLGNVTNEVVYRRLAPALLPELKRAASKAERKSKLHQWLTQEIGHPKLREHLSSLVAILKLSKTPQEFMQNVDMVHPRYGDTMPMTLTLPPGDDDQPA